MGDTPPRPLRRGLKTKLPSIILALAFILIFKIIKDVGDIKRSQKPQNVDGNEYLLAEYDRLRNSFAYFEAIGDYMKSIGRFDEDVNIQNYMDLYWRSRVQPMFSLSDVDNKTYDSDTFMRNWFSWLDHMTTFILNSSPILESDNDEGTNNENLNEYTSRNETEPKYLFDPASGQKDICIGIQSTARALPTVFNSVAFLLSRLTHHADKGFHPYHRDDIDPSERNKLMWIDHIKKDLLQLEDHLGIFVYESGSLNLSESNVFLSPTGCNNVLKKRETSENLDYTNEEYVECIASHFDNVYYGDHDPYIPAMSKPKQEHVKKDISSLYGLRHSFLTKFIRLVDSQFNSDMFQENEPNSNEKRRASYSHDELTVMTLRSLRRGWNKRGKDEKMLFQFFFGNDKEQAILPGVPGSKMDESFGFKADKKKSESAKEEEGRMYAARLEYLQSACRKENYNEPLIYLLEQMVEGVERIPIEISKLLNDVRQPDANSECVSQAINLYYPHIKQYAQNTGNIILPKDYISYGKYIRKMCVEVGLSNWETRESLDTAAMLERAHIYGCQNFILLEDDAIVSSAFLNKVSKVIHDLRKFTNKKQRKRFREHGNKILNESNDTELTNQTKPVLWPFCKLYHSESFIGYDDYYAFKSFLFVVILLGIIVYVILYNIDAILNCSPNTILRIKFYFLKLRHFCSRKRIEGKINRVRFDYMHSDEASQHSSTENDISFGILKLIENHMHYRQGMAPSTRVVKNKFLILCCLSLAIATSICAVLSPAATRDYYFTMKYYHIFNPRPTNAVQKELFGLSRLINDDIDNEYPLENVSIENNLEALEQGNKQLTYNTVMSILLSKVKRKAELGVEVLATNIGAQTPAHLYDRSHLLPLTTFIRENLGYLPVDLLIDIYANDYTRMFTIPTLAQHVGTVSTNIRKRYRDIETAVRQRRRSSLFTSDPYTLE